MTEQARPNPDLKILENAGAAAPPAADVQRPRPGPPPAVVTSMMVVFAVVLWLALPTLVLGHNWTEDSGELKEALQKNLALAAGLFGGLMGGIAGAMMRGNPTPPPPAGPWDPRHPDHMTFDEMIDGFNRSQTGPPFQPPPPDSPRNPITGEPWDPSSEPYPRDPVTGEPVDPAHPPRRDRPG